MVPNEIIINNIKDNEELTYSTFLLKGTITHNNCDLINNKFMVVLNGNNIKNVINTDKQFKVLLELKQGLNLIIMNFCCLLKELKVFFNPKTSLQKLVPLYIIIKNYNGLFQAPKHVKNDAKSACKRIETVTKLLQCFIAEKLNEEFFERKTFQIEPCKTFYSNLNLDEAIKMSQKDLWESLGREIMVSKLGDTNNKYLGVLSCTKYLGNKELIKYDEMINKTEGFVAMGGGGFALLGSACLYTWPEEISEVFEKFADESLVDCDNFLNDSCYRNTLGACFSTTLGSVLHELCHTFDLGHTQGGVMGRGFDDIHEFFLDLSSKNNLNHLINKNGFIREKSIPKNSEKVYKSNKSYFTQSCLAIIFYHKFFNDHRVLNQAKPSFNIENKVVHSTNGIRVIEIREKDSELVLNSWVFLGRVLKFSFQIHDNIGNTIIVAVDNLGNILKQYNES
ncbi:uncharacterized protein [Onthophagus taurus]|uniref:uncharacterized protein isoform X2 n=1 Tax=Onthophagus taurus TaxID=166361 RepID=UPI0039BE63E6